MDPFSLIGYAIAATLGVITLISRVPKQTITNQKDLIESYEKRLKDLEEGAAEKDKQLAVLAGKVDVLQTIPLAEIAVAIKEIVHTQKEIIKMIKTEN
jgi:hypothetical protein